MIMMVMRSTAKKCFHGSKDKLSHLLAPILFTKWSWGGEHICIILQSAKRRGRGSFDEARLTHRQRASPFLLLLLPPPYLRN